jgi:hypothetical protein
MSQQFNDALNDCLERISQGESLQACLSDYPNYSDELGPLVQVAMTTMDVSRKIVPSPQSKDRNFQQFMQAVQIAQTRPQKRSWFSFGWFPLAKPIAISLVALAVLVMGAGVTTAASNDSVPGERLYWVKTTKENIQLRIPRSDESKAQTHANLANVRAEEMRKLVQRRRYTAADGVMKRMNNHLRSSAVYVGVNVSINPRELPPGRSPRSRGRNVERLRSSLEYDSQMMRVKIEQMFSTLSPEQKQQLSNYMRQSELFYRMLIEAMTERGNTGQLPFIRTTPPQGVIVR